MLATLSKDVVEGPRWVFEEKYDGIRLIAHRAGDHVRLLSRNDIDRTASFPEVALAVQALPDGDIVLDGEVFAYDRRRVSRFELLPQRARPTYAAFDLLQLDGRSLLRRPLRERRELLETLLRRRPAPLQVSRRLPRDGKQAYAIARERGWEGIIAKDEESRYEPGARSRSWLKVKIRKESEFVIGGFTAPSGARTHLGALLVGLFDGKRLRYAGKVGTGFSGETLRMLARRFAKLRIDDPPFDPAPRIRSATWLRPELVAQVAYAEWTGDGKLRHPVFLALRDDKRATECVWRERE